MLQRMRKVCQQLSSVSGSMMQEDDGLRIQDRIGFTDRAAESVNLAQG
jgi:hypothetical protein